MVFYDRSIWSVRLKLKGFQQKIELAYQFPKKKLAFLILQFLFQVLLFQNLFLLLVFSFYPFYF